MTTMLESIKNFFTDPHGDLLAERDQLEAEWQRQCSAHDEEIERLENLPLSSIRDIEETRREIAALKDRHDVQRANYQIARDYSHAKIEKASSPEIDRFKRWCNVEIERTSGALSIVGTVEKNLAGHAVGCVESNSGKVQRRVAALRSAIAAVEGLRTVPQSEVPGAIAALKAGLPSDDLEVERFDECSPAIVSGLSYPPPGVS